MKKSILKLITLVLAVFFTGQVLANISPTFAYLADTETPTNNKITAGILDLSLDPSAWDEILLNKIINLDVNQSGSLKFQYQFKATTDDNDFCSSLELEATLGQDVYSGPLAGFTSLVIPITDSTDSWQFKIIDPDNWVNGKTCNFNFTFQAWQLNQDNYNPLIGFSDTATIAGSVNSSQILEPPAVTVIVPNGGETWWVGRRHEIIWSATNPNGDDGDLVVDLYYSADSGQTWGQVAAATDNTGSYFWRVPLFLDNGTYWVPSPTARVKVVAYDPHNPDNYGVDISDEDYCPPIDYSLITPEERAWLKAAGLLYDFTNQSQTSPAPTFSSAVLDSEDSASAESTSNQAEPTDPEINQSEQSSSESNEDEIALPSAKNLNQEEPTENKEEPADELATPEELDVNNQQEEQEADIISPQESALPAELNSPQEVTSPAELTPTEQTNQNTLDVISPDQDQANTAAPNQENPTPIKEVNTEEPTPEELPTQELIAEDPITSEPELNLAPEIIAEPELPTQPETLPEPEPESSAPEEPIETVNPVKAENKQPPAEEAIKPPEEIMEVTQPSPEPTTTGEPTTTAPLGTDDN